MAYGLQVWDSASNVIMDTTKDTLFLGTAYSVSLASGANVNVTTSATTTNSFVNSNTSVNFGCSTATRNSSTQINLKNDGPASQWITDVVINRGD